jgi:methylated-DNA-[protein]-cysteine S-methyltransferase
MTAFRLAQAGVLDDDRAFVHHDTPIGVLTLAAGREGLLRCAFGAHGAPTQPGVNPPAAAWLDLARRQLDAYFEGMLRQFTVPVDLQLASAFDRPLLALLADVLYGQTTTYGRLAAVVGLKGAEVRGVGQAMGRNPVAVIVPCHRVVGADGSLVGYGGGLPVKRRLLDLETADTMPQLDLGL